MPAQLAPAAVARQRLSNQGLTARRAESPGELVRWLGAVQAQDFAAALWALGQRLPELGEAAIEAAIADRSIVRTWPMRRTLHFVPGEDARWMLRLLASRQVRGSWGRYRQLGLDEAAMTRSARILDRALGRGALTRAESYAALAKGGVDPGGQRGIHVLSHLSQEGLLCLGPRRERQPTFVLLEAWLPAGRDLSGDEALSTLAARYFASHGPATLRDFAWWTGLNLRDSKRAVEAAGPRLEPAGHETWIAADSAPAPRRRARAALLPPWDEYLVAYRDRSAATAHLRGPRANPLRLLGSPLVVIDGTVRGSWRRERTASGLRVRIDLWTRPAPAERQAVAEAVERYGSFAGEEIETRGLRF
jgi:hypothetical protein